jgi:hypothetical protein
MRARTFLLTLTVVSSLLAAPPARGAQATGWGGTCAVRSISSPQLEAPAGHEPHFPAGQVVGIEFEILLAWAERGAHRLELRLYTPQGHLYQSLPAEFTIVPQGRQRLRAFLKKLRVHLSVPGSPIVTHSLYGRWEVRPHVDDAAEPCGGPREFWIDP